MTNKKSPKPLLKTPATLKTTADASAPLPLAAFFLSKKFLDGEASRKARFFGRKGCDLLCSAEDFSSACLAATVEHPGKSATEIIAIVVNHALQGRSRSAIATIFIDREAKEGETKLDIEQPEADELEEWRSATDDEIETLRQRIREGRNVTDRCARQILQKTTGKVERADTDDLFGRDSYRGALGGSAA